MDIAYIGSELFNGGDYVTRAIWNIRRSVESSRYSFYDRNGCILCETFYEKECAD